MNLRRFVQIVAVILLREQRKKVPMLVQNFWGVKTTQDVDLPRKSNKTTSLDRVTDVAVGGRT